MACLAILCGLSTWPMNAAEPAPKPPNAALNGLWRAEISDSHAFLLRIEGAAIDMRVEAGPLQTTLWNGTLVVSEEHPDQHMDWTNLKSGTRVVADNRCLFRLAGDTLLVIGGGPKDRPKRFYTGPGSEPRTLVFSRVLPVAGKPE